VEFESDEAAQRCIEQLNGKDLKGRPLRVNEAENRPPRPPGSGFSRPSPGGGGYARPGGFRSGPPPMAFPPPEEMGDGRGRRFRQKPDAKPARKTNPRRRRDAIVDDDDEY
jgi:RNA recognition motif-containing protein